MKAKQKGLLFALLSALCFAIGGLLLKLNNWSSLSVSGFRSFFAAMVFWIYMKNTKHTLKVNGVVILGALANSLTATSFVIANKLTTAANAIILQFTMPVFIILLLWMFYKKRPSVKAFAAAAISLFGVCFFFFDSISKDGMLGNIIAVLSGFFYAIVFMIKKMKNSDFESSAFLSFILNTVIGLFFIAKETDFGFNNIWTGIVLGIVQIGLAYVFLNAALDNISPVAAALTKRFAGKPTS